MYVYETVLIYIYTTWGKETHLNNNSNTSILNRYNQTNKYGDQDLLEVKIKIIKLPTCTPFQKGEKHFSPYKNNIVGLVLNV